MSTVDKICPSVHQPNICPIVSKPFHPRGYSILFDPTLLDPSPCIYIHMQNAAHCCRPAAGESYGFAHSLCRPSPERLRRGSHRHSVPLAAPRTAMHSPSLLLAPSALLCSVFLFTSAAAASPDAPEAAADAAPVEPSEAVVV